MRLGDALYLANSLMQIGIAVSGLTFSVDLFFFLMCMNYKAILFNRLQETEKFGTAASLVCVACISGSLTVLL